MARSFLDRDQRDQTGGEERRTLLADGLTGLVLPGFARVGVPTDAAAAWLTARLEQAA
jgi:hypothetical protein